MNMENADAESDYTCSLCMKLFVDPNTPKQLDCQHVYCQVCLTELFRGAPVITCPECCLPTTVPVTTVMRKGGVGALKTSSRLRDFGRKSSKKTSVLEENVSRSLVDDDKKKRKNGKKESTIAIADNKAQTIEQKIDHILQLEKQVVLSAAATEHAIDVAVVDAINKAKQDGEVLKAHLKELTQKELQEYQNQKDELNREKQCLENMAADIGEVLQNAMPDKWVTKLGKLESKFKKMGEYRRHKLKCIPEMATT